MRPIFTFTISALSLVMLYVILTSANTNTGALSMLLQSAFSQFNRTVAQLQGRGSGGI